MTTGRSWRESNQVLLYDPAFMDPSLPTGLWWLKDPEEVAAVKVNAVCRSALAAWDDVAECGEFLEQFPYILLAAPPGEWRDEAVEALSARVSVPVVVPTIEAFRGCWSVLEYIGHYGVSQVEKLLYGAEEIPVQGLLNVAEVDVSAKRDAKRVLSGIRGLDCMIGGFTGGGLSVWTGKRGEGKSTFLGQILLDAVNQGHRVCAYSGELPKEQFKLSLLQQAAGYRHGRRTVDDRTGRELYTVDPQAAKAIDAWWDKCLFLTDIQRDNAHDEDTILKLFEYARRRYGCDTFLVDNIMTAQLKSAGADGQWQAQSLFTGRLVAFSKAHDVHVHLVAHPRKTGKATVEADDVGGSSDITNRADNVFKVERVPEEQVEHVGASSVVTVLKNREFGALGAVKLDFNPASRRFYPAGGGDTKKYSWEMSV